MGSSVDLVCCVGFIKSNSLLPPTFVRSEKVPLFVEVYVKRRAGALQLGNDCRLECIKVLSAMVQDR